jgi:hypothetical protein
MTLPDPPPHFVQPDRTGGARAAKLIFGIAGIYGLVVLLPLFLAEPWLAPPLTRPEDYYGFLGVATVFQLLYLAISRDPIRYRPLMPLATLAKLSFFTPVAILRAQGRTPVPTFIFATIDLLLGIAFLAAWRATRPLP